MTVEDDGLDRPGRQYALVLSQRDALGLDQTGVEVINPWPTEGCRFWQAVTSRLEQDQVVIGGLRVVLPGR